MSSTLDAQPGQALAEWRAHWPVVLAACAGVAISTLNTYSLGVFMQPLQAEFGWSRAAIASGQTIAGVSTVIMAPLVGGMIDRFGPRRIGIPGVTILCLLTALLSTAGPSVRSWQGLWMLLALINVAILPNVWTAAVTSRFFAGRGLALAVTLCGSGLGSMITPVLSVHLIDALGWRHAYLGMAGIWGAVVIPVLILFFRGARDQKNHVAVPKSGQPSRQAGRAALTSALEILLTARFLRLALATLLIASVIVPLAVTLVPILTSRGLARGEAASIASLMGIASICGRLMIGYLLDRVNARVLASIVVCIPIVACLLLISNTGSHFGAIAAVVATGLSLGAELDIVAYLTSRYISLAHFGLAFGALAGLITLGGGGLGPLALGSTFDHFSSYVPALWVAIPMCMSASLLFLSLGAYPADAAMKLRDA